MTDITEIGRVLLANRIKSQPQLIGIIEIRPQRRWAKAEFHGACAVLSQADWPCKANRGAAPFIDTLLDTGRPCKCNRGVALLLF